MRSIFTTSSQLFITFLRPFALHKKTALLSRLILAEFVSHDQQQAGNVLPGIRADQKDDGLCLPGITFPGQTVNQSVFKNHEEKWYPDSIDQG
ncbi:MAG: hypothetical protein H6695_03330 [Deferribacteres bacterium]|nr:hypothetical protein [candidate division KSB1 bacterium]MCB9509180.1 hypothetical protein [Deferribacteres bacterium]